MSSGVNLDFFGDANASALLGAIVALSGEVLVLKAQVKRLTAALEAGGVVSDQALEEAGETEAVRGWLARESDAQTEAVLAPVFRGDHTADVRALMGWD